MFAIVKPPRGYVGKQSASRGNGAFVEAHLRVMERIFTERSGKARRYGGDPLGYIGKILRAAYGAERILRQNVFVRQKLAEIFADSRGERGIVF